MVTWVFIVVVGLFVLILFGWFTTYHGKRYHIQLKQDPKEFPTVAHVSQHLQRKGLASCNVTFAIDYHVKNQTQGKHTWFDQSLHHLGEDHINPYQEAIRVCAMVLQPMLAKGPSLFMTLLEPSDDEMHPCHTFYNVMEHYIQHATTASTEMPRIVPTLEHIASQVSDPHIVIAMTCHDEFDFKRIDHILKEQSNLYLIIIGVGDGDRNAPAQYEWSRMMNKHTSRITFVPINQALGNPQLPNRRFSREQEVVLALMAFQNIFNQ